MKLYTNETADVLILERGEEVLAALKTYATDNALAGAWLQSGLGGAKGATLSFYDLASKRYIDKVFDEPLEIISLQGNLSWTEDEPFWHVHGVFGTKEYQSISGHVKELTVALTGELFIQPLEIRLTRTYDEVTGLKLLSGA